MGLFHKRDLTALLIHTPYFASINTNLQVLLIYMNNVIWRKYKRKHTWTFIFITFLYPFTPSWTIFPSMCRGRVITSPLSSTGSPTTWVWARRPTKPWTPVTIDCKEKTTQDRSIIQVCNYRTRYTFVFLRVIIFYFHCISFQLNFFNKSIHAIVHFFKFQFMYSFFSVLV